MAEFVDGLFVKRHEKAPPFVVCNLGFKVDDFVEYAKANKKADGYINVKILTNKNSEGMHAELDTYVLGEQKQPDPAGEMDTPF